MRTTKTMCGIAMALGLPLAAHAQFQQATADELKMTEDANSPGAAAVYLNVAEIANNDLHFESHYARIKVLTEKGKDLATVELPYQKDQYQYEVSAIQGRTIHPDGSIVQLTGKPADVLVSKSGSSSLEKKVFTLPNVTVGSILEYYYQLRYSDDWYLPPRWTIQQDYFVHKAHYMYTPFRSNTSLSLWTLLPNGVKVIHDSENRFKLDMENIPAAPDEEWMPPIASTLYQVVFYFLDTSSTDAFWKSTGNNWSKSVDEFCNPSKEIQEAVAGLVTPGDAPSDKAKKLYAAVQALDNTDYSREKSKAELKELKMKQVKRAGDVWRDKGGTATELTLLYLSMLKAAGLQAYAMRIVDRNRGLFTPGYLYYDQLDDTIVLVMIDGKEIALDPGEKMCPFQTLNWRHSMATGLRQGPGGSALATTPRQPYQANTIKRVGELEVDAHGVIDGDVRIVMTGQEALYWRQKALLITEPEVKTQFDNWIGGMIPDGVGAHVDHFIAMDKTEEALAAVVRVQGTLGTATSKRLLIPALFFETHGSHPFVDQKKRLTSVDMHYADEVADDITYRLPAGLTVESAPQESKVPWEGHAVLVIKCATEGNEVTVTRTLVRGFTFAPAEDYQNLRDFYQKVATADQQQLVLAMPAAGKGN